MNEKVIDTSNNHISPLASSSKHTRTGTTMAEYRMSVRMSRSHFSFHVPIGKIRPCLASAAASGTPSTDGISFASPLERDEPPSMAASCDASGL
jgi:hypothetical protein